MNLPINPRRLSALIIKEFAQIRRDPSAFLITFILPLLFLFIFGYGVNLENNKIRVGLIVEDSDTEALSLGQSFLRSSFLDVVTSRERRVLVRELEAGKIRGFIVIGEGFSLKSPEGANRIQLITDGAEPNTAAFLENYAAGIFQHWHTQETRSPPRGATAVPRVWYNPELRSRFTLIPGSVALVMTLIGTLLTALVVAREWERGTMEALITTPVHIAEILLGKLIPYFCLGMVSMFLCWGVAVFWYKVPFEASFFLLGISTAVFLLTSLGQGLLISTLTKDQFLASQISLMSAFLPSFMLSGFVFEIASMPWALRLLSSLLAPRYFVDALRSLFLAGNLWGFILFKCLLPITLIGAVFFIITFRKTAKRLF